MRILRACLLPLLVAAAPVAAQDELLLKYASFDPALGEPDVPAALAAGQDVGLWIVQFDGRPTQRSRDALVDTRIHTYLPDNAYLVQMSHEVAQGVRERRGVRYVGAYHPAYRLERELLRALARGSFAEPRRFRLVVVDKRNDKPALIGAIHALGGRVVDDHDGSLLLTAELTGAQLLTVARLDQVMWIDRWTPTELDMDNARKQGGADYIEGLGGYRGQGLNGHVYEGLEPTHPDFSSVPVNVRSAGRIQQHGHCTAGIVFGNGTSAPQARGLADRAGVFYTDFTSVSGSRWQVASDLVNVHDVSFTTAAWGNSRTSSYTSISAETDDIIFDHDIAWTQAHSNSRASMGRPQSWAKNVFSIGGVVHFDNDDPLDDSWAAGSASIGLAADGRIKPMLVGYYDNVWTSDLTGAAGYANGDSNPGFGGTSASSAMVAGFNALAIQLFTDALFNNTLRNPGGTRHSNRPHFPTLKALMIANARQYAFDATSADNRREHQGWGFPDLRAMYNNRARMFVVDETDVLTQGASGIHSVTVLPRDPELKVAMSYADLPANPAAARTRVNDLDLKVTAPDGTVYWGNQGLLQGRYSVPGGSPNSIDVTECVFVKDPAVGTWLVEVRASLVVQDSHVETPAIDADYGLCVSFGARAGTIAPFGSGCLGGGGRVPGFDVIGRAQLAESLTLEVADAVSRANGAVLLGLSNRSFLGGNLPFDFGRFGAPNCSLLVSTEAAGSFVTDGAGDWSGPLMIPAVADLRGARLYQQAVILDSGANALGVAFSRAFEIIIGD